MYLVVDKNLEVGQRLNRSDVSQNLYKSLSGEDIYYPKLKKTFTATYSTSPTGDVNCDLLDDFDYVLSLYEYVYMVKENDNSIVIDKKLNDNEYIDLILDIMIKSNKYKEELYDIAKLISKRLNGDDLIYSIYDKIGFIVSNLSGDEVGWMNLMQAIYKVVPDKSIVKSECLNKMCNNFIKNIDNSFILLDEEKEFLDKCFKKYYKGNYDKAIFDKMPVCDLPF